MGHRTCYNNYSWVNLMRKIPQVPSTGSTVGCTLLCGQQLTLFTRLVTDVLDLWAMFLLDFCTKHPVKCIIMGRAVDISLAEDHMGINNHWSTVQSVVPFLTRCLAGPPESKVDLGRSVVYVHWKHPQTGCVCKYLYLTDLEAHQSMVTMPDGLDSDPVQEKQVLGKDIWIPLCLSFLYWVGEMLIWPIFSIMRPKMI